MGQPTVDPGPAQAESRRRRGAGRFTRDGPGSVGLVHDYLLALRGAERTFAAITECWPDAPIYTLLYDPELTRSRFAGRSVHASFLQRTRLRQRGFRSLLPLFPAAAGRLPVGAHDLLISSSSAFAHGVRLGPGAIHLCYCHSPFRYVWHEYGRTLEQTPRVLRPPTRALLRRIRAWDRRAASAVTHYIANSKLTRERIRHFYGRDAVVVHPPVQVERFTAGTPGESFLVVSELVRHKRVELALEAARLSGQPIKVVGTGPELRRLRARYGSSAEFLGRVPDDRLAALYAEARALVVPNVEEFGIAAVEAQASGRPVIAAAAGGATETVIPGETGLLVPPDDLHAFARAMRSRAVDAFSSERLRRHAGAFSTAAFRGRFAEAVARLCGDSRVAELRLAAEAASER